MNAKTLRPTGRRGRWTAALALVTLAAMAGCRAEPDPPRILDKEDPQASSAWWKDHYDAVPDSEPRVARARTVFERMEITTGQHAALLILDVPGAPSALALADDTVLLNREGLALCYRDVVPEKGDALLSFVFAHELRHLAGGDLWHASAFLAVREAADGSEEGRDLVDLLRQDRRNRKVLELRADGQGVLAMMMEGYDPEILFQGEGTFFQKWVNEVPGRADSDHPEPAQRARFLQGQLRAVADKIHLFQEGVKAFDAGDYPQAVERLQAFRQNFAGREVLNDLALAHYQLAAAALARCDGTLVDRYRLPVALDRTTLADRARLRGAGERSVCFQVPDYHAHMTEALALLGQAADQDPTYLPARLNLVAALALDQQGAGALEAADQAAKLAPEDPRALAAVQVAGLVYSDTGGTLVDPARAIAALADLHRRFPENRDVTYDLASALSFHRRLDEARPVWREFLLLEPEGPWADVARGWVEG